MMLIGIILGLLKGAPLITLRSEVAPMKSDLFKFFRLKAIATSRLEKIKKRLVGVPYQTGYVGNKNYMACPSLSLATSKNFGFM